MIRILRQNGKSRMFIGQQISNFLLTFNVRFHTPNAKRKQ
jgi:hypothetical protein